MGGPSMGALKQDQIVALRNENVALIKQGKNESNDRFYLTVKLLLWTNQNLTERYYVLCVMSHLRRLN